MADAAESNPVEGAKRFRLHTGKFATVVIRRDQSKDLILDFEYADDKADDKARLRSEDGSYDQTQPLSAGKRIDTLVQLAFKNLPLGKKFSLSVDGGSSGSYQVFKNILIGEDKLADKNAVYVGRFLDKVTEEALSGVYVYVDTPGDDKVRVENHFKTGWTGLGGRFMPGRDYNFYLSREKLDPADVEKLQEGHLTRETASAPYKPGFFSFTSVVFKLEIKEMPKLAQIIVHETLPISDVSPPHLIWDPKSKAPKTQDPALLLKNKPLKFTVKLQGSEGAGAVTVLCDIENKDNGKKWSLKQESDLSILAQGGELSFELPDPLTDRVAVNELSLKFAIDQLGLKTEIAEGVPLRVYTIHAPPVANTQNYSDLPPVCKVHLEHACRWANGASENIGTGAKSIPHQVDNQMRHYVHPKDFGGNPDFVSVYDPKDPPPVNYKDLPGSVGNGRRSESSLYYPPVGRKTLKDYEEYDNYQENFGWKLLDNLTHTGGRCNQQAALVCDLLGVLGIKAEVYYLWRRGFGEKTHRPIERRFNCYENGTFWNFHGIAKVYLDDGSAHMYDGSFSSPPNRKNGSESWATGERGPFIYSWRPFWNYIDTGEQVPEDDVPSSWEGIP